MEKITYRPDIDGLRAIAVLAVLIFHTDRTLLSGGFVGVDIFFVISGYLITSIIISDITNNKFSLYYFYDRRVRRIIPALLFFLVVSSIASFLILFPDDLYKYVKSLLATLSFFSNIYFWRTSGYFSPASDAIPLLHTWSLSIEEQFYLFFPIFILSIIYFSKRNFRKNIVFLLGIAFITSFALSVWGAENRPSPTFYLLPTRAWELLLGSLLAFIPRIKLWSQYRSFLTAGGGVLIFMSFYFLSNEFSFPGKNALPPCIGASMIILANHKEKDINFVSKYISIKPLVFTGLISYSLYLWHWGFIVYYKHYTLENPSLLIVIMFSFIVATFSWRFIEKPFRNTKKTLLPFFSLFLIILGLLFFSYHAYTTKGIPKRLPSKLSYMSMEGIKELKNPYQERCFKSWGKSITINQVWKKACRLGVSEVEKKESFVLIGDSHSDALFTGIDLIAKKTKIKGLFFGLSGCNPVQGMFQKRPKHKCEEFKRAFYKEIYKHKNIKLVVFSSRWASSLYGYTFDLGPAEPLKTPIKNLLRLSEKPDDILSIKEREKYFGLKMRKTIVSLLHSGKKVVLFASVPEVGYHVPKYMARKEMSSINVELVHNKKYFYSRQKYILKLFSEFSKINGVSVIYPHKKLCIQKGDTCMYQINGKPLYRDDDHLSVYGANYIAPMIENSFRNLN